MLRYCKLLTKGLTLLNRSPLVPVPKPYGSRSKALRFENQRATVSDR